MFTVFRILYKFTPAGRFGVFRKLVVPDDLRVNVFSHVNILSAGKPDVKVIKVGVIGLLKAYQNYKDTQSAKFSTYAYPYIFGEMYQLVHSSRDIKVSKDMLKLYKLIEKTRYELAQRFGYVPNDAEVAQFLELETSLVSEAVCASQAMISLDDEANELNLHEVIADQHQVNADLKIDLDDSFQVLNSDELEIIKARYFEDLTQSEVAKRMNMTQVMVSRYEKKAMEKMKIALM